MQVSSTALVLVVSEIGVGPDRKTGARRCEEGSQDFLGGKYL